MTIDFPNDARGRELLLLLERAKYERWLTAEVNKLLLDMFNQTLNTILSPAFRQLSPAQQTRKLQLFRELDQQIRSGYAAVDAKMLEQMQAYAKIEAGVAHAKVAASLSTAAGEVISVNVGTSLTTHLVKSVAELPIRGLTISEWFERQATTMSSETKRIIQSGILDGKSIPEIVRQIVPPRGSTDPALFRRARGEANAITRTAVNAVQNKAAVESYNAIDNDVSDSFRIVAVRDSRTTPICRAKDGLVQRSDDPDAERPPFHIGCRTTTIPVVKGLGADAKTLNDPPHTMQSYAAWLGGQSTSEQNTILGPTRAEWWRDGKMTLAEAIDGDNRVLTLAQLRERLSLGELVLQ